MKNRGHQKETPFNSKRWIGNILTFPSTFQATVSPSLRSQVRRETSSSHLIFSSRRNSLRTPRICFTTCCLTEHNTSCRALFIVNLHHVQGASVVIIPQTNKTYVDSDDLSNIMQIKSSFNQVKCNIVWNIHILFVVSIVEDVPEVLLHVPEALHIVAVVHGPHLPCTAQVTRQNVPAKRKEKRDLSSNIDADLKCTWNDF